MYKLKYSLLISLFLVSMQSQAQSVKIRQIEDHIEYLASDELEGRRTGSKGERLAADYIADHFSKFGLKSMGNNDFYDKVTLKHKGETHDKESKKIETIESGNVVGYVDNGAKNTVIIGAHYDHLGLGHDHNSRDDKAEGQIHNGADDNASGVAGLIELARLITKNRMVENNNYLFIAFTGEELGLLGSKKYCEKHASQMKNVNYMINMDMIGRLNSKKRLMISGVGTSDSWTNNIFSVNEDYFSLKLDSCGIGPSDHTSFYHCDIPVLHIFSGQHNDYHKPTDDIEKINYLGTKEIIEFIYDLIMETDPVDRISFYKTKSKQSNRTKFKVTLGIMPDYTADVKGLRIDGVQSDRPAEKAGMLRNDIITKLGDTTINDIYDYMKALAKVQKGQTVQATIIREGKKMQVEVTF